MVMRPGPDSDPRGPPPRGGLLDLDKGCGLGVMLFFMMKGQALDLASDAKLYFPLLH